MLSRSHAPRLDHNQENPGTSHHHLPTKTPARAGKSAAGPAPLTGGKGLLSTAKTGRVLGTKDRNGGKRDANEPAALLFPGKPQAGPSCAPTQQFKTPAARKTLLRPAAEMMTPATGVRPKHAPPLVLGTPSPDVSMKEDEHRPEEDEESDKEVEYAGPSARDYDEPFIPDHLEPNYKAAAFGEALRGLSLGVYDEDWNKRDATDRDGFQVEMDDVLTEPEALEISGAAPTSQPIFPIPTKRRARLSAKPSNSSISSVNVAVCTKSAFNSANPSAASSTRKPLAASSSSLRRPPSATSTSSTAQRNKRPASTTSSLRATPSMRPGSSLSSTKSSLSSSILRKPSNVDSTLPSSTLSRPRPTPLAVSRTGSSASLRTGSSLKSVSSASATGGGSADKKAHEERERALGVFGVLGEGEGLLSCEAEGVEEVFKFDLTF
ncbi:hypothetical protein JCM11641_004755 [Rhodosporidiobolus odoratus]